MLPRGTSLLSLASLSALLCACIDPDGLDLDSADLDGDLEILADDDRRVTAPVVPRDPVDPRLALLLAGGDAAEEIDVDLRVAVAPFEPAALAPMVATIEVHDRAPSYTLDGRIVDEAGMAARAEADRRTIDEDLARQFAARRALVDRAIADAGVADAVRERGNAWFRVRLPRERARRLLVALAGRLDWAAPAQPAVETTDLRNDLHEGDGEDGALERMGIIDFAHGYGMRGAGIGIWHNEGNAPYPSRPEFADADLRYLTAAHWQETSDGECRTNDECCSKNCTDNVCVPKLPLDGCQCGSLDGKCVGDIRGQEHATLVALIAHETAPQATIYHTATSFGDCMISDQIDGLTAPPVYVGAQSWSYENGGGTNNSYNVSNFCNGDWDQYIMASRIAHFHSSGNWDDLYVGSPARAYNVIAVGNYDHVTETMIEESGRKNPSTGVEKPEIVAPGTEITAAAGWTRSGSSISSPMAAGFAADLMSGSAFFRNQPQAVKAYLMAGAHGVKPGTDYDGAGRIDYLDTYFYRWGKVWNGANSAYFNAQNKIVETRTLTAGKHYTIAISWLADGTWAYNRTLWGQPALSQKLALQVTGGGWVYGASSQYNNSQRIEFVAPASGTYTITIERTYNSGAGNVALALTVGEHS